MKEIIIAVADLDGKFFPFVVDWSSMTTVYEAFMVWKTIIARKVVRPEVLLSCKIPNIASEAFCCLTLAQWATQPVTVACDLPQPPQAFSGIHS